MTDIEMTGHQWRSFLAELFELLSGTFLKICDFWKMIILVVVIWDQIGLHGVTGVIAAPLVVKTRLITDIERALMVSGILFLDKSF